MAKSKTPTPVFKEETNQEQAPSKFENIVSILLGLAVVFVIGTMVVNTIRNRNAQQPSTSSQTTETPSAQGRTHTVQSGDTVWSIAEQYYNDGFQYPKILEANNLTEQSSIEVGQTLIIPELAMADESASPAASPEVSVAPTTVAEAPSPTPATADDAGTTGPTGGQNVTEGATPTPTSIGSQYTVVQGDSLWNIAVAKYNDGYRWTEIARLNNLDNPDLIHPGNVLQLP